MGHGQPGVRTALRRLQAVSSHRLGRFITRPDAHAVAAALVLGDKRFLQASTRDAFAGSGAMHILAVSGLHVGIVYLMLSAVVGRVPLRGHVRRIVRIILLLTGLWGYALLTGSSPSVLRAATMLSFVVVGQSLGRRTDIYNTLAASAFLLLVIDPMRIHHLGFQLSYLAVLGIIWWQPRIEAMWTPRHRLLKSAWSLTAVSLAAQAATAPLAILAFHQFPTFFLLTNLVAIPLAGLILPTGLAVLVLGDIPAVGWVLARVLDLELFALVHAVRWIDALPGAVIQPIIWTPATTLLVYLGLIALGAAVFEKITHLFRPALALLGLAAVITGCHRTVRTQPYWAVYAVPNTAPLVIGDGRGHGIVWADVPADSLVSAYGYALSADLERRGVHRLTDAPSGRPVRSRDSLLAIGDVLVMRRAAHRLASPTLRTADHILIHRTTDEADLSSIGGHQTCIFDGSFRPWHIAPWDSACRARGLDCHFVLRDGPFIQTLTPRHEQPSPHPSDHRRPHRNDHARSRGETERLEPGARHLPVRRPDCMPLRRSGPRRPHHCARLRVLRRSRSRVPPDPPAQHL